MCTCLHRIPRLTTAASIPMRLSPSYSHFTRPLHTSSSIYIVSRIHRSIPTCTYTRHRYPHLSNPSRFTTTVPSSTTTSIPTPKSSSQQHQQQQQQQQQQQHEQKQQQQQQQSTSFFSRLIAYIISRITKFVEWYSGHMDRHPIRVQAITSFTLFSAGDLTAQFYELMVAIREQRAALGKTADDYTIWDTLCDLWAGVNGTRLASCATFGAIIMGPVGHTWYCWLDRFVNSRYRIRTVKNLLAKVALDTAIFNPLFLIIFFSFVSTFEGMTVTQIYDKLYRDLVPSYAVDTCIWPWIQSFNFTFVPVKYQLLVVNLFCYFDDIFVSYVQHNGMPAIFQWIDDWWFDYIKSKGYVEEDATHLHAHSKKHADIGTIPLNTHPASHAELYPTHISPLHVPEVPHSTKTS